MKNVWKKIRETVIGPILLILTILATPVYGAAWVSNIMMFISILYGFIGICLLIAIGFAFFITIDSEAKNEFFDNDVEKLNAILEKTNDLLNSKLKWIWIVSIAGITIISIICGWFFWAFIWFINFVGMLGALRAAENIREILHEKVIKGI